MEQSEAEISTADENKGDATDLQVRKKIVEKHRIFRCLWSLILVIMYF